MRNPNSQEVREVLAILQKTYTTHPMHEAFKDDAFQMLIAVVLSQRATDAMTIPVAHTLFEVAPTPHAIATFPQHELEKILRPIGFFHAKAAAIQKLSRAILEKHHGKVPQFEVDLLALPQVGRKTANIMLTLFFGKPQIAVDVHVHRITHRLGGCEVEGGTELMFLISLVGRESVCTRAVRHLVSTLQSCLLLKRAEGRRDTDINTLCRCCGYHAH
jgi:endonuclease-3